MNAETLKRVLEDLESAEETTNSSFESTELVRKALAEPDFWEGYVPEPTVKQSLTVDQPAQKRPQNCGTSYCSCIECVMEPVQQEPVNLRRGDLLRCIETDELCTVWATSPTGNTLIKWSANNFGNYTAEQIGELFWLEPAQQEPVGLRDSIVVNLLREGINKHRARELADHFISLTPPPAPMSEPNRVIAYAAASKLRELGYEWMNDAWTHLDELAEQPAQPEPEYLAFMDTPQRTWVSLTFAEICECESEYANVFARNIEAKLRSKNT